MFCCNGRNRVQNCFPLRLVKYLRHRKIFEVKFLVLRRDEFLYDDPLRRKKYNVRFELRIKWGLHLRNGNKNCNFQQNKNYIILSANSVS